MQPLTLEQAKGLCVGDIIYHLVLLDSRGYAKQYRVVSVKTWKTAPNRVRLGVKHGLYQHIYLDETSILNFSTTDCSRPKAIGVEIDVANIEKRIVGQLTKAEMEKLGNGNPEIPQATSVYIWAKTAVRHLPKSERDKLLRLAITCIMAGGLKGNVSDIWREHGHTTLSIPMLVV